MNKLRSTGQLRIGEVTLIKVTAVEFKGIGDVVSAMFTRHGPASALNVISVGRDADQSPGPHLPYGACTVFSGRPPATTAFMNLGIGSEPFPPQRLRGGAFIDIQGPRGAKQIARRGGTDDYYSTSVGGGIPGLTGDYGPEYLVPGLYTADNPAGPDVGAFRATLTLPAPIQWTNQDSFSVVRRSQDLTVTWTGGDSAKEFVEVNVTSYDTTRAVAAEITCTERASAGRFTIPSWLLSTLPASSGFFSGTSLPAGRVNVRTYTIVESARFQAEGIDVGYFGYEVINLKSAAIQ
jgi:hypothetical protein